MGWEQTDELSEDLYWRCLEEIDYSGLREPYRNTIRNYVERGLPPGTALRFALEGSIKAMLSFQDPLALETLVRWAYQVLPSPLWGSRRKVRAWMRLAKKVSARSAVPRCTATGCRTQHTVTPL
jgi:hypothetical protein